MNYFKFLFLLLTLTLSDSFAQSPIPTVDLTSFKWGLKDYKTNEVILLPKYDYIQNFKNGLAVVKQDEFYGLIDTRGNEVAEPVYGNFHWVNDTLLKLKKRDVYGLVSPSMKEEMPFIFKSMLVFGEHLVVNNGEKSGIIDFEGNIIIPFQYDEILPEHYKGGGIYLDEHFIRVRNEGKVGIIDYQNKVMIPIQYESVECWGSHFVMVDDGETSALLTKKGEVLIPLGKYTFSDELSEGLIPAAKDGKFGFIDPQENVIVSFEYDGAHSFQNDMASVKKNGFWGAINRKNEVVAPFEYNRPILFYNGLALLEKKVNDSVKLAYMNTKGQRLTDFIFDEAPDFKQLQAKVRIGDKWGVLGRNGESIIPVAYDKISIRYGYVVVSNNEKYGLYKLTGEKILSLEYSFVYPPQNHPFIMVRVGREYGYVNHSGKVVIPIIYENARSFSHKRATVLLNGESYEIDWEGKRFGTN